MNHKRAASLLLALILCLSILTAAAPAAQAYRQGYDGMGPKVVHGGQRDFLWPLPGHHTLESCFYDHRNHCALDIAAPIGTPIIAAYDGVVVSAFSGGYGDGFGNYVALRHDYTTINGDVITLFSRYSHMSRIAARVGQTVTAGTVIGYVGSTGYSTGPHLDFQILRNNWDNYKTNSIDPYANDLLVLPDDLVVRDNWDCGKTYYALAKAQYATPVLPDMPTVAELWVDKRAFAVNETVFFRMRTNGASNTLYVTCPDGSVLTCENVTDGSALAFGMQGVFHAQVEARGPAGALRGETIAFRVGPPQHASVSTDRDAYAADDRVTFATSSDGDANTLWITGPDGAVYSYGSVSPSFSLSFETEGVYRAHVEAINDVGSCESGEISFRIGCEHAYQRDAVAPTCTEPGSTGDLVCAHCGKVAEQGAVLPAKGHSWSDWSVAQEPTDTDAGTLTRACAVCGETETRTVPSLSHVHALTPVEAVSATCTEDGAAAHWVCGCGQMFADAEGEHPIDAPEVFPAAGHEWNRGRITLPPTETAEGETLYTCKVCGETRTESIGKLARTNPFSDVEQSQYFFRPVLWAISHEPEITNGTDETHFSPDVVCTRAQAVTFLWRAAGAPEPTGSGTAFSDVPADAYYAEAVLWAVENGITSGTGETTFDPDGSCTRAQIVTFLWRAHNVPAAPHSDAFRDVAAGQYYTGAVYWAVAKNVTSGTGEGAFSPDGACTRAQIVTFLYRSMA